MNKLPLDELFKAMYHEKFDYHDFLTCAVNENWEVAHYRGGQQSRPIHKPNAKLKAYHKFLNLFLFERLPINANIVFSYRKGVGPYDAVAPHANSKYFFQTDINEFFWSITKQMVISAIESGVPSSPIADLHVHQNRIIDLVCIDDHLPIGFPTSPLITNSVLKAFDDLLEQRCQTLDVKFSRYSDDIILSAATNDVIYALPHYVNEVLADTYGGKFSLNAAKSRHFKVGGKVKILGLAILPNGQVTIDAAVRREIEVLLHFYVRGRDKFLNKVKGDLDAGAERVAGYLNYINAIDQEYLDKLRRKYGATTVDLFLHRSFE